MVDLLEIEKYTMKKMSPFSHYVKSSIITFVATFSAAVLPMLGDATWEKSALLAITMVGFRAGVKAVLEYLALIKA